MRFVFAGSLLVLAWGQDLRSPPRCTGPECAERVEMRERRLPRRSLRRAEARVDRFGRPKPRQRVERFRPFVYTPRHKPMERWEAFRPYDPSVSHRGLAERFRPKERRPSHRSLARAERQRPFAKSPRHRSAEVAERQRPPRTSLRHSLRAERLAPPGPGIRHFPRLAERRKNPLPAQRHTQRAERWNYSLPRRSHTLQAEKQRLSAPRLSHDQAAHRFVIPLPVVPHRPRAAERYAFRPRVPKYQEAPQGTLYARRPPKHRRPNRGGCEPPSISHFPYAEQLTCQPLRLRRIDFDRYACTVPAQKHRHRIGERVACAPPSLRHKNFDKYACGVPQIRHYPRSTERIACAQPAPRHKNFDRYSCKAPQIRHRPPQAYDVPCDAQRQGVMTATERLAHDLRYVFTRHRKHCDVVSAYTGFSQGEWVNTQAYGRVPVAGYKMGWRVYVFAHFYDRQGKPLKKPRLEKRKVRAVKQIEVWVLEPASKKGGRRRYIKGLPGIEGFGEMEGMQLVKKRLSVAETKAIQIEKLIRKRQIAWLVRAFPEERVRLPEWLKKYAGPKPPHLWPGVDYRLLEIW